LRTPLTTLKVELGGVEPDVDVLRSEVRRLARLVEQLLTLARLEQGQWQRRFDRLLLSDVYARVIDELRDEFERAGMTLETRLAPVELNGDATLLEILLRNLLRNVLDHCSAGTTASVTLEQSEDAVRLRVADDGPGIDAGTLRQMSRGFTRLDSKSEGFGLGLAICHRIVAAHGGAMRFADAGGAGLAVEVDVPRA
jgi:two-component system sensor histidine kinase QseC